MKNGLYSSIVAVCICTLLFSGCVSTPVEPEPAKAPTDAPVEEKLTPEPTEKPTQTPEPIKKFEPNVGEFWMEVPKKPVAKGSEFSTKIRINTGDQKIAAYGIRISFDPAVIDVDTGKASIGVEPGPDGFLAAENLTDPGTLFAAGFDVYGKGPGDNLHILTIHWKAVGIGISTINISVNNLVDEKVAVIGVKKGLSAVIEVE